EHALADAALQDRLSRLQRGFRGVLLAGGDGRLDALDRGLDAAVAGAVDRGPLDGLAQALFRRLVMSHETYPICWLSFRRRVIQAALEAVNQRPKPRNRREICGLTGCPGSYTGRFSDFGTCGCALPRCTGWATTSSSSTRGIARPARMALI